MKIKDLPEGLEIITDSRIIQACKRVLKGWNRFDFDSVLVEQLPEGFSKAYGFSGWIPQLDKDVIELPL